MRSAPIPEPNTRPWASPGTRQLGTGGSPGEDQNNGMDLSRQNSRCPFSSRTAGASGLTQLCSPGAPPGTRRYSVAGASWLGEPFPSSFPPPLLEPGSSPQNKELREDAKLPPRWSELQILLLPRAERRGGRKRPGVRHGWVTR